MAHYPISLFLPQWHVGGVPASGYVLKAYQDGTSTLLQMATDNGGGTLVNTITLNAEGYPAVSSNPVIPHVDQAYKLSLYPSQAAADANSGAVWTIDNLTPYTISSNLAFSGNTMTSTNTNGDIILDPDGTGEIHLNATTNIITADCQSLQIGGVAASGQGSAIASAATVNLTAATGEYVHITGTTTITAITLTQGIERTVVFDGALTLTNDASLLLPGSANITTAAGDTAVFRGEAAGVVRCIDYTPKNNYLATIASYVSASRTYLYTDGMVSDSVNYITDITENTWESVGPTGSGAANIWAALDAVPPGATMVRLWINSAVQPDGADRLSTLQVYARQTGSSAGIAEVTRVLINSVLVDDYTGSSRVADQIVDVPIDSSRRFDLAWAATGDTTRSGLIRLRGFSI